MEVKKIDEWLNESAKQFILCDGEAVRNKDGLIFKDGDLVGVSLSENMFTAYQISGFDIDEIHVHSFGSVFEINDIVKVADMDNKIWINC